MSTLRWLPALTAICALFLAAPPSLAHNMRVTGLTVMHDGRSILIEAKAVDGSGNATDPDAYGPVDWAPGWLDSEHAVLSVTRGYSVTLNTLIFTGASIHVTPVGDALTWDIYALIPNASNAVIHGDGLAVSIDDGWLRDDAGNSLDGSGSITITNYSLVGTDGFIDESLFTFDDTIYVDPSGGDDHFTLSNHDAWTAAHTSTGTYPVMHLSRAIQLWNDGVGDYAGGSAAIRVRRGTSGSERVSTTNINRSGSSFTSPLLISTYDSGDRPHITYDGEYDPEGNPLHPWGGILRSGGGGPYLRGDYVYINGLYLQSIFTGDRAGAVGITMNDDGDHFVVSDCKIEGFFNNINLESTAATNTNRRWWSAFRNIIIDARGNGHSQGIHAASCRQGFLISQNVLDQNGYQNNGTDRDTFSHNLYLSADINTVAPFVWGNLISRGGAFGCRSDAGGVIYGNLFAENALGCVTGGTEYRGGGRIARNYFERSKDLTLGDTPRGYGPGVAGSFGPSIIELNCVTNSPDAGQPIGIRVEQYVPNSVASGDFEASDSFTADDKWAVSGDGATRDTSNPHGGSYSALFNSDSPNGTKISEGQYLFTGEPVHLSFWLKRTGGTTDSVTVKWEWQVGSTNYSSTIATLSNTSTSWTLFSYSVNVPADRPKLSFEFHSDTGSWNLDDVRLFEVRQDFAISPEVFVRNNTINAAGPFAPYIWADLFPVVVATRNCWDDTNTPGNDDHYAMWVNPDTAITTLLQSDYNIFTTDRSDGDAIRIGSGVTGHTFLYWTTNYSSEDAHSSLTTPTYATTPGTYDLGNYAVDLTFSMSPDVGAYYDAVRGRAIGDNTASKIDFLGATAHMMSKYEVTSPTISGGPMPFYGSGDGSDPQDP